MSAGSIHVGLTTTTPAIDTDQDKQQCPQIAVAEQSRRMPPTDRGISAVAVAVVAAATSATAASNHHDDRDDDIKVPNDDHKHDHDQAGQNEANHVQDQDHVGNGHNDKDDHDEDLEKEPQIDVGVATDLGIVVGVPALAQAALAGGPRATKLALVVKRDHASSVSTDTDGDSDADGEGSTAEAAAWVSDSNDDEDEHTNTNTNKNNNNMVGYNAHLTSTHASQERCNSIRRQLDAQHRRNVQRQQKRPDILLEEDTDEAEFGGSKAAKLLSALPAATSKWFADEDSYNLDAYHQINGIWPLGHPLPLPDWAAQHMVGDARGGGVGVGDDDDDEAKRTPLHFDSVWQYEDFTATIETLLQRMLAETHYDTMHLFIDFYRAFKRTRRSDLRSFFQFYDIPLNRRHHMCVSLALEIMTRLIQLFPVLEHYLYMVSCEEQVVSPSEYIETCDEVGGLSSTHANVEKEHAMVAMRISIAGREGVIILDPGYHVGRAVTVMQDQLYPHTGWFTQSKEAHLQRDYCYNYCLHSRKYVEWMEREIRAGDDAKTCGYKSSLVYVDQPYVTAIDVTVRRNLVYNFRSLLARSAKGRVYAGIYFPLVANPSEAHFTLFYDDAGTHDEQRIKVKFMFNVFKHPTKVPDNVMQHLSKLAPQMGMPLPELVTLCRSTTEIVMDQDFIKQTLAINDDIANMSGEN